jgi:hypothetical protein
MHTYSDISHFRAPYRNVAVHGFGQEPAQPQKINEVSEVSADGVRRYKAGWRETIMWMLSTYRYIFLTNTQVKLTPMTQSELQAAEQSAEAGALLASMRADRWVEQKVREGYAVMVPFGFLFDPAGALASEAGLQLGATTATDKAAMVAASEFPSPDAPIGAYVAEPGAMPIPKPGGRVAKAPSEAGLTPLLWAAGIIVLLGGGAYYLSKKSTPRVGGRAMPRPA